MKKSKLIKLLRSLNQKQLKALDKMLHSSFFKVKKEVILLFDYLYQKIQTNPDFSGSDKQIVFKELSPQKPYSGNLIRHWQAALCQHIESLLLNQFLEKHPVLKKKLFLQAFPKTNDQFGLWQKETKAAIRKVSQNKYKAAKQYFHLYEMHSWLWFHPETDRYKAKGEHLRKARNNLDKFYLVEKLKLECELIEYQKILRGPDQTLFAPEIEQYLLSSNLENIDLLLKMYGRLFKLLQKPVDNQFLQETILLYEQSINNIHPSEQIFIYQHLQNYLIREFTKGDLSKRETLFHLYQICLKQNVLFDKGQITDTTFTNIVIVAANLGEFVWTESFIRDYQSYLPIENREKALALAAANLHFQQGQYQKIGEITIGRDYSVHYKSRIKAIQLKADFELFKKGLISYSEIDTALQNFRAYLRRERKFSEFKRRSFLNFVAIISKLIVAHKAPKTQKEKLKRLAIKLFDKPLIAKEWLREKLEVF